MRFNIKDMKKQGIFLGILSGFLAIVITISYITGITASVPTEETQPESSEIQTESTENTEQSGQEVETVKPHSHNWVKGSTVEPTCTEGGYTINTCFCGENKTTNEKDALGHQLSEWETQEPDENGVIYKVRSCSRCDYIEKEEAGNIEQPDETPEEETPEENNPEDENTPENSNPEDDENPDDTGDDENPDKNQDPDSDENADQQN